MLAPLEITLPKAPVGAWFEAAITWVQLTFKPAFDAIGEVIGASVDTLAGLLTEPSAAQLTVLAAAIVAFGLVRRGRPRPAALAVAVWLVLAVAEGAAGVAALAIQNLPAPLFLWAMGLFGADYVDPQLVLALLLLAALVATSLAATRSAAQWRLAGGSSAALLALFVAQHILGVQPALLVMLLFTALALAVAGWRLAVFALLGFLLIISMDKWEAAMSSLALILVATAVAVVISVPIGILAAYNDRASRVVKPVLDFMQTLPAFVYLIPAISFFGVGQVPGIIATVIFAMPPGVRLTELGIRQVDKELIEAGEAFGAPDLQILRRIQLPLALATIMAGVNQVIMLSLSMVVIAGMVGAGGLGNDVYTGIARSDVALGFEGGIAVVVLAIFLDRLTGAVTRFSPAARAQRAAR
ncbi:ABC transporter permease [Marinitenerispora sediminis]|uniref:Phosphate ABC transporter permease n=1 Tax=Marinitenerispora sediminis TaxID=1931232 RepID=A0A368T3V8_9ACTN|nr:ABC transporter permease subunit [Marinitenerispora sediminis]RCV49716.1 phosphate ABC transporter permease [Marinitenerispora sediminis]RCV53360.1 phosphate ABC transporter permease [Marinitenerispora sediminis]RCV57568.1 phosphate ABC transporter permease [Marinitenerispora sediminis]